MCTPSAICTSSANRNGQNPGLIQALQCTWVQGLRRNAATDAIANTAACLLRSTASASVSGHRLADIVDIVDIDYSIRSNTIAGGMSRAPQSMLGSLR